MREYWVNWQLSGQTMIKAETPEQAQETFEELADQGEIDWNGDRDELNTEVE